MMTRWIGLVVPAICLLSLAFASAASSAAPEGSDIGWTSVCSYSHSLKDDPIVYPGQPGLSHMHDFYGNTSTNAFSTIASLLAAGTTTCAEPGETAAYWVPALMYKGGMVQSPQATIYYRSSTVPVKTIQPMPPGLIMIAGNSHATGDQPISIVNWTCGDGNPLPEPANCGPTTDVSLHIHFPSCWDGRNLDSSDHQSHMAYPDPDTSKCPPDHPVSVPEIMMNLQYPGVHDGTQVMLMSGPPYTAHADFMNAWVPATMTTLTTTCINAGINCKVVDATGPQMIFTQTPPNPSPSSSATFAFYPNEDTKGPYTCKLDASPGVDCSSGTFQASNLASGPHTLTITATDLLGNVGVSGFVWTVETAAPVVTLTGGFPSGWSTVNTAGFTLSANEDGVTYTCQLDAGSVSSCTNKPSYTRLLDGPHTFTAWGTDAVGHKSAPVSQSWIQDRVAPVVTITSHPANPTTKTTATFTFTGTDLNKVTFTCRLDSGSWVSCSNSKTYSGLHPGVHNFTVVGTDPAGNSTTALYTWTVIA